MTHFFGTLDAHAIVLWLRISSADGTHKRIKGTTEILERVLVVE